MLSTASVLLILLSGGVGHAATTYTEEFSSGLSGWTNTGSALGIVWRHSNGTAQVQFNNQMFPFPESAVLVASNAASGGAFTGNYESAGIGVIGFDFMTLRTNPSILQCEWRSGTNIFFKDLTAYVGPTGVWHSFCLPIASGDASFWAGAAGSLFASSRTAVTAVAITVQRRTATSEVYRVDRIYVDRRHQLGQPVFTTNTILAAENLRTGRWYSVERAATPLDAMTPAAVVTAFVGAVSISLPATNSTETFRLLTPVRTTLP